MKLPVKYDKIDQDQRRLVRLEYVKQQNNKCWYCQNDLDGKPTEEVLKFKVNQKWFPLGFFDNPVHLQHDHNTGLTEGAVHAHCNAVLWEYFQR